MGGAEALALGSGLGRAHVKWVLRAWAGAGPRPIESKNPRALRQGVCLLQSPRVLRFNIVGACNLTAAVALLPPWVPELLLEVLPCARNLLRGADDLGVAGSRGSALLAQAALHETHDRGDYRDEHDGNNQQLKVLLDKGNTTKEVA